MSLTPKAHYSVEPITTEEGLSHLEQDWNRLSETTEEPNAFMTFGWFRAWNHRFAQEDRSGRRRLNILVLKQDGAVAGISPLIYREASRFGLVVRKVEFVERLADYNDVFLGNDRAGQHAAIVNFLAQTQEQWDIVDLRDLRETEHAFTLIESALSQSRLKCRLLPEADACPYLPIDGGSAAAMERLSGDVRRKLRKRMERARARGLRVRIVENPQDEPGLLDKMIALEGQKRVDGKLVQPFVARYPEAFQSLFDTLGPRGWVYVALVELEDRLVAWQLGFLCGKRVWDFSKAFDDEFHQFAPGTLLVPALLDYGFSRGYREYDFLRGADPYKLQWSTGIHQTHRLLIWSRRWTSRARAYIYLDLKTKLYRLMGKGE
jgi:CelD/BcsL family acetyltransferase involved in cellulose biosynthesis